jgi:hypothetical protein
MLLVLLVFCFHDKMVLRFNLKDTLSVRLWGNNRYFLLNLKKTQILIFNFNMVRNKYCFYLSFDFQFLKRQRKCILKWIAQQHLTEVIICLQQIIKHAETTFCMYIFDFIYFTNRIIL